MRRNGCFGSALLIGLTIVFAGGCQQWNLSVEGGDVTFVPGRPVEIKVVATKGRGIPGNDGIVVSSFAVPDPVRVRLATGDNWTHFTIERRDDDSYFYTLSGVVNEPTEYVIDAKATVVDSVGRGRGPFRLVVDPLYVEGLGMGLQQRSGRLQAYRLLIGMREEGWTVRQTDAFLAGFAAAYADDEDELKGQRCADVLRLALLDGAYQQGFQQGQRHGEQEVTSAYIQTLIGNHIGQTSTTLAWKAGYINGFAQEYATSNPAVANAEEALRLGETMYDSLKHGIGL